MYETRVRACVCVPTRRVFTTRCRYLYDPQPIWVITEYCPNAFNSTSFLFPYVPRYACNPRGGVLGRNAIGMLRLLSSILYTYVHVLHNGEDPVNVWPNVDAFAAGANYGGRCVVVEIGKNKKRKHTDLGSKSLADDEIYWTER